MNPSFVMPNFLLYKEIFACSITQLVVSVTEQLGDQKCCPHIPLFDKK